MNERFLLSSHDRDPQGGSVLGISLLIMGLAAPLLVFAPGLQSLDGCDESFYAQMAREMLGPDLLNTTWLDPTYLGDPFFEKPPLLVWLITLFYRLGGINEWTARLPGILSALLAIPLVGWIGRQFLPRRAAILAMAMLPLCYLWLQQGRLVGQDMPLLLIELVGIAALVAGIQGARGWYWLTGIALGLGLLMKSAMILLVGVALLPYLIQQQRHWLGSPHFWLGQAAGLSLFGTWLGVSIQRHGSQVWQSLLGKVQDLGSTPFHAHHGWLYYVWHIPLHGFPWTALALVGGLILLRRAPGRTLLIWSLPLLLFVLLTLYPTRTHYYTLQLYPWLVLLAGVVIDQALLRWRERGMDIRQPLHLAQWLSWIALVVGIVWLTVGVATLLGVSDTEMLQPHAIALVIMGLCYSALPLIWGWRRVILAPSTLWVGSLFLANAVAMTSVILRPDFGNLNPALARLNQNWAQEVVTLDSITRVDIGRSGLEDVCQAQAVVFYTPNPGVFIDDEALLANEFGSHLWLSPVQQDRYQPLLGNLQSVVTVNGWQLMERIRPASFPNLDLETDPSLDPAQPPPEANLTRDPTLPGA